MIPNVFHFCFAFVPESRFGFLEYLAVRSAREINRPERIYLHYRYECSGPWWERAKEIVCLDRVEPPTEIYGRKLSYFAHRCDVLRLMLLAEHGGIYMDVDTLCLRPFTPLLEHRCVLGWQGTRGPCNAVILSEPKGEFVRAWLESYRSFRSTGWDPYYDEHSVLVPARLAREEALGGHVTLLDERAFYFPLPHDMRPLFASRNPRRFRRSYCVHYWESLTHGEWLSRITPDGVLRERTNFARFARRALRGEYLPAADGTLIRCPEAEENGSLEPLPAAPSRKEHVISSRVSPWFGKLARQVAAAVEAAHWLGRQAKEMVWLPRVIRGMGWGPGTAYVAKWLLIQMGQVNAPFLVVRSKRASYPLRCRPGTRDTWAFEAATIHRQFQCLDEVRDASLIVDCRSDGGYAAAELLTRFPSATAIVLEPDPATFRLLQSNLAPYGSRARTVCGAVWAQPARLVLGDTGSTQRGFWRRRVRIAAPGETADVTGVDIATLLRESGFERISILKMDIGDTESAVFGPGCEEWLGKVDHLAVMVHGEDCRAAVAAAAVSQGLSVSCHGNVVYARRLRARSTIDYRISS